MGNVKRMSELQRRKGLGNARLQITEHTIKWPLDCDQSFLGERLSANYRQFPKSVPKITATFDYPLSYLRDNSRDS